MSLKAKLEAVIYAAEEPVTLAQLATLFAADALEWKAEQEAARAAQAGSETDASQSESQTESGSLPFLTEEIGPVDPGDTAAPEPPLDAGAPSGAEPPSQFREAEGPMEIPIEIPVLQNADGDTPEIAPDPEAETGTPGEARDEAENEAEARRLARLHDREVKAILRQVLDGLIAEYSSDSRGVEIREIAGGYRMATKPECHDAVRSFVKSLKPALKLSLPALETLAVIAYKQPVTAPEVNDIRGVDSSGVFGSLLARKLIATAGRKQVIGRPILYKTTKEFLLRFGLKDVSELPSMEEFEKMAASELEEPEALSTEIGEPEPVPTEDTPQAIEADLDAELHQPSSEEAGPFPETTPTPETVEQASTTSETE
jgi:segregation and condensation protein B